MPLQLDIKSKYESYKKTADNGRTCWGTRHQTLSYDGKYT